MTAAFCQWRHIFGREREGFHAARIAGLAANDLIGTIFLAYFISYVTSLSFLLIFAILMLSALLLHRLFCVDTTLTRLVFGPQSEGFGPQNEGF